jgi:hypothetical protein
VGDVLESVVGVAQAALPAAAQAVADQLRVLQPRPAVPVLGAASSSPAACQRPHRREDTFQPWPLTSHPDAAS